MSPDLVERVADRLHAAAHPYREGALDTKSPECRLRWHKAARYALALAERAARIGWASGANAVDDVGPPDWWKPEDACFIDEAVQRAVEGA